MAISMKNLETSLYDDSDDENKPKPTNLDLNNISDTPQTYSSSETPKQSTTKGEESKALWIKGQVSESLKRLSRISPVTLDHSSINDSVDEEGTLKTKLFSRNSTPSENKSENKTENNTTTPTSETPKNTPDNANSNNSAENNSSKKQWIKGQINSYISKSKRLYNIGRNESSAAAATAAAANAMNEKNSPSHSPNLEASRNAKDNMNNTNTPAKKELDNVVTIVTQPPTTEGKATNNTVASTSTSISVCAPSPIVISASPPPAETSVTHNNSSPDSEHPTPFFKVVPVPSKLTFSELLNNSESFSSGSSSGNDKGDGPPLSPILLNDEFPTCIPACEPITEEEEINNLTDIIIKEDLQYHLRPGEGTSITFYNIWIMTCLTCVYFLCDLPPYLFGVITGSVCTYLAVCSMVWLLCPSADIYDSYQSSLKSFLRRSMRPEVVKPLPKLDALLKPKELKGWVSLATIFNEMFDKDLAKDVFLLVHNETMYIFLCKINESESVKVLEKKKKLLKGRAKKMSKLMAELQVPIFTFERVCEIDLCDCTLSLKPDDLSIRRIWNKKYPIELCVPKGKLKRKNINLTLEEMTLTIDDIIDGENTANDLMFNCSYNEKAETFYLFGNTGREKEDWFYRMQLCIEPLKHQVTVDDYNDNKLSKKPCDSYPHYMAELIKESEKVMQRTANGKKMEPYLAWLNIFLGRAFWDFWHESVWEQRLHQKIQTRLNKLNTPPFITDIKLKALNCGHNIPIIHKGSMPVLDEHGIWTDLQVSYKGYFTLTLETQLNIDYYVDLVTSIVKQKADPKDNVQLSKIRSGIQIQDEDNLEDASPDKEDADADADDESGFHDEIQDVFSQAFENTDIPGLDAEIDPVLADPRTKAFLQSRTGKKVVSLVGWLAKSKIAKRVAETDFAKKAYERAYKKFQKMPIVLKVEIQSVKGNVAVNIPPPPTNRLWFGFRGNPVIFITASPKIGDKQVRLTYLTNWIERKLKEEFKKFLVLPNMQDISIKLMDSHILDLTPDRPDL